MRTATFVGSLLSLLLFPAGALGYPFELPAHPNFDVYPVEIVQSIASDPGVNPASFTLGPATFSTLVFSGRNYERVIGQVQRDARTVMKQACNEASRQVVVNGRKRRLRYTYRVEWIDIAVTRDGVETFGTANVSFSCVLR